MRQERGTVHEAEKRLHTTSQIEELPPTLFDTSAFSVPGFVYQCVSGSQDGSFSVLPHKHITRNSPPFAVLYQLMHLLHTGQIGIFPLWMTRFYSSKRIGRI